MIRFGEFEFFASEWLQSNSMDKVLIPRLEREHGANHRLVHEARRFADKLREAEYERVRLAMKDFSSRED
jgi:hypothetical protein